MSGDRYRITNQEAPRWCAISEAYRVPSEPAPYVKSLSINTVYSFNYDFDPVTSNLKSRDLHGTEEHFFYDTDGKQLNRLAGTGPDENTVSETYAFADNGNITEKQGVGEYVYHPDKKNAVTQIDIPELGQNQDLVQFVSYNHFNSASEIKNLDDQLRVNLEYGSDDQRRVAKYWDESGAQDELIKTRLYAGAYEKQTNADLTEIEVHYISAGGQLAAIYVVDGGVGSYYYPHQDHLGSIIHLTDANGDIVYTQNFDPWGRTCNPSDLTYDNIPERPDWLWRGYTGHEHLDEFGLINMNGRLYDPVVGRMLSPDNYVQNPDFSQSYNRYSYVWNNPLKYTDPSGEWVIELIVGAVVGAYISGMLAEEGELNPTQWAWDGNTWSGVIVGAIIGGALGVTVAKGALTVAVGIIVPGGSKTLLATSGDGFELQWTNNAGGSGSHNLSGNNNQPSNWINPDALAAIVAADMNHQYTPLYRELEGHVEPLGLYPEYCYGCVGLNGEVGDFALGPITVGFTLEVAYPNSFGKQRGFGLSVGLAADNRNNGIGFYVTHKKPIGTNDVMFSLGPEVTYSQPMYSSQMTIDNLGGGALEGNIAYGLGLSYSRPYSDSYRQYGLSQGWFGINHGGALWKTHTTITPWFY